MLEKTTEKVLNPENYDLFVEFFTLTPQEQYIIKKKIMQRYFMEKYKKGLRSKLIIEEIMKKFHYVNRTTVAKIFTVRDTLQEYYMKEIEE